MAREKRRHPLTAIITGLLLTASATGCGYQGDVCNGVATYEHMADEMGLDADRAWKTIRGIFRCNPPTAAP